MPKEPCPTCGAQAVPRSKYCEKCRPRKGVGLCSKCGQNPRYKHSWWCTNCVNEYSRRYKASEAHKRKEHRAHLRRTYGLKPGEYEHLLVEQGGGCAVCGVATANNLGPNLHVDHDHQTGAVRGLLCFSCNLMAGYIERKGANVAQGVLQYLESWNGSGISSNGGSRPTRTSGSTS